MGAAAFGPQEGGGQQQFRELTGVDRMAGVPVDGADRAAGAVGVQPLERCSQFFAPPHHAGDAVEPCPEGREVGADAERGRGAGAKAAGRARRAEGAAQVGRRPASEDDAFQKRVARQPVGAVDAGGRGFAARVQGGDGGAAPQVGLDAADGVVGRRVDRDGVLVEEIAVLGELAVDVPEAAR